MAVSNVNIFIGILSLVAAVIYSGQSAFFTQKLNELLHWKTGCNPKYSIGNVSLHYFATRGRAEAIRLLMEDHHIPYTETEYTKETWQEAKIVGIDAGIFIFGQVPAIVTSKNKHLVQSKVIFNIEMLSRYVRRSTRKRRFSRRGLQISVILQYLGRSVGLDCDCRDLERCDIIAAGIDDLYRKQSYYLNDKESAAKTRSKKRSEYMKIILEWFSYFENLLPLHGLYFASERLTWVDYLVFDMLEKNCNFIEFTRSNLEMGDENEKVEEDTECVKTFRKFPKLLQFFDNFHTRDNLQSYMNSTRRHAYNIPKLFE